MTAEEIRNAKFECDDGAFEAAKWIQECAAQLADANRQAREMHEHTKANQNKLSDEQTKLREAFAEMTNTRSWIKSAGQTPPLAAIVPSGSPFPIHLACLVRVPDTDKLAFATPDGLVTLEPEEEARILALLRPAPEGPTQ